VIRREVITSTPLAGDYILNFSGLTWNILRSNGDRGGASISTGDRERRTALAKLKSLAETEHTNGWESAGGGLFRQIARSRP
jgi:hypothetical protein